MKFYIGSSFKNCDKVNEISEKLENNGWIHTYNWAKNIIGNETKEDLIEFSKLEKQAIIDSDVIIIILPAGRGTHIELGMALALNKKVFLCSFNKDDFNIENTVNFYEIPEITKIVGNTDDIINRITNDSKKYTKKIGGIK